MKRQHGARDPRRGSAGVTSAIAGSLGDSARDRFHHKNVTVRETSRKWHVSSYINSRTWHQGRVQFRMQTISPLGVAFWLGFAGIAALGTTAPRALLRAISAQVPNRRATPIPTSSLSTSAFDAKIGNTPSSALHTGMLWAEGPAWNAAGRYLSGANPNNVSFVGLDGRWPRHRMVSRPSDFATATPSTIRAGRSRSST